PPPPSASSASPLSRLQALYLPAPCRVSRLAPFHRLQVHEHLVGAHGPRRHLPDPGHQRLPQHGQHLQDQGRQRGRGVLPQGEWTLYTHTHTHTRTHTHTHSHTHTHTFSLTHTHTHTRTCLGMSMSDAAAS